MTISFARRMRRVQPSAIRELLTLGADPHITSFGGGYPDPRSFPQAELTVAYQQVLTSNGAAALQYATSKGVESLREHIAARMRDEDIPCTKDDVLVVQGAQQALDLIAKLMINKGNYIVCESPTFLGALLAFNPYEPRYAAVAVDEEGMRVDQLDDLLNRTSGAKLIYVIPDFQNPTGVTLSLRRRRALLEVADRRDLIIIEDSPYRDIRFEGESLPTLKSLDRQGRVVYVGSFSKILAPGLRTGWVVASPVIIEKLGLLKLAADTQCSTLNMTAISQLLQTFDLPGHIRTISTQYRHKKALMLDTIRRTFPSEISCTNPSGGLFTWLTFPDRFDAQRFLHEEAIPRAKVAYVPGGTFFPLAPRPNYARLSYATQTDEAIVSGISALGELLQGERARGWPHCATRPRRKRR